LLVDQEAYLGDLVFRVAAPAERGRVLDLRRSVYGSDLGHDGLDDLDEAASHLIAVTSGQEIVAAFRLVGSEQRPFELESFVDLSFLSPERSPAVLDRLCIRKDYRKVSRRQFVPIGMLKLALGFARRRSITDFVILALPHLQALYRTALFQPFAVTFTHPTWGEVHPMHLDLIKLEAHARETNLPLIQFLFRTNLPNFQL
jgi:predicted GNAT family N-acyltransferase